MRDHVAALKSAIAASADPPLDVHYIHAASPGQKYVVLSTPLDSESDEPPVCGLDQLIEFPLRVKAVTGTPDGVLVMHRLIRAALTGIDPTAVTGRHLTVEWVRSEFVAVDTTTTITGSDRHPALGVATYRVLSQPN